MKFRGKMAEYHCIRKFYAIISSIAKIAKTCVMRLTVDKMYLIMSELNNVVGGPAVWGEIDQENFFNEYNIEGVTPEHNEIYLEFSPDKMFKTLTSLKSPSVKGLKMKLTKKNSIPCLTFEVDLPSIVESRLCVHDIPVQVVPRRCWSEYEAPILPPVHVSLCLPDLKVMKRMIEKYRILGSTVAIAGRRDGSLSLKVESDEVVVASHFKNLRIPVSRSNQMPWIMLEGAGVDSATVRVDLKRLNQFLCSEQLVPERSIANIVDNEILHIMIVTHDLALQFFLPRTSKN